MQIVRGTPIQEKIDPATKDLLVGVTVPGIILSFTRINEVNGENPSLQFYTIEGATVWLDVKYTHVFNAGGSTAYGVGPTAVKRYVRVGESLAGVGISFAPYLPAYNTPNVGIDVNIRSFARLMGAIGEHIARSDEEFLFYPGAIYVY